MTASMISGSANDIKYPQAPTSNTVDVYFGNKVADPYRSLENDTSASTLGWVEAERKVTEDYLSKIPFRDNLRERIKTLMNRAFRLKRTGSIISMRMTDCRINRFFIALTPWADRQRCFSTLIS